VSRDDTLPHARLRDDGGSATIVVVTLLGMMLVLTMGAADVARVLSAASRAQTAADAAALAAAQGLAIPGERVPADVAAEYAERNGGELQACVCHPGTFVAAVTVRVPVGDLLLAGRGRSVVARARAIVDVPA
jgi:secretion/DNA translocation related TadE-like protein